MSFPTGKNVITTKWSGTIRNMQYNATTTPIALVESANVPSADDTGYPSATMTVEPGLGNNNFKFNSFI